jgi:hypothetical protein
MNHSLRPSFKHPARGFALVSTPRAGLVSPASTRRCVTDERPTRRQ